MAAVLARAPLFPAPLPGCRPLCKVILSLRPAYPRHMPPASLGSFRWRQLYLGRLVATTPWMASPWTWASGNPCLVHADFYKASVRNLVVIAGSSPQWRRIQPATGAAGPSRRAGLFGRGSLQSLGRQPAGSTAFGIPRWLSPRH
jgi:hypothetical protein